MHDCPETRARLHLGVSQSVGAGDVTTVRLRILATSDLHMHLEAYDYYSDEACPRHGLAMTASLIEQARAEVPTALLFDNGDFLQGSPLGDYVSAFAHRPHPMIQAMNHLRYDAANLGNHEFSHGVDYLTSALREARFPFVSANTQASDPAFPFLPPVALIERSLPDALGHEHLLRIGVIGVLPPQTAIWDSQAIAGRVRMSPMVAAVAHHVPRLRASGADLVIVLAHTGIGPLEAPPDADNAGLSIATIPGVDAIVLGHVHLPFPSAEIPASCGVDPVAGTIAGKPAIMPGFFGSHLGIIDLEMVQTANGWRVARHSTEARAISRRDAQGRSIPTVVPNPEISAIIRPAHQAAVTWARRVIGSTDRAIHSYFSMVTECCDTLTINRAQADYVTSRLKGGPYEHLPVLSATAPFKAGGHAGPENYSFIAKGPMLLRNAADLYIHPNTITALRLTGAQIRRWLARSAIVFHQIIPGRPDQPLLATDIPSFQFDMIAGLDYEIDLSADPFGAGTGRITRLNWQGRPLRDDDWFILATNSYRSSGSGGFFDGDKSRIVLADQKSNRDILIAYLSQAGQYRPDKRTLPAWRFAPMPGTSVVFDTAPDSRNYLDDVRSLSLSSLGLTQDGFLRYRLWL